MKGELKSSLLLKGEKTKIIYLSISTTLLICFLCSTVCFAGKLEDRVENSIDVTNEVMRIPEKGIPSDLLKCCRVVAIFPNVLKGGFIFGVKKGKEIICARDPETENWSAPAFFTLGGGSWDLQMGAESTDLVLVIMTKRGLGSLLTCKGKLGGVMLVYLPSRWDEGPKPGLIFF